MKDKKSDYGHLLEIALKELIRNGNPNAVQGYSNAFENAIGLENCKKLLEILKPC